MTDSPVLLEERIGAISLLRLNRPDRLNAINGDLMDQLLEATERAAKDDTVRALVLTGAGRAFCSGGDVRDGARPKHSNTQPKPKTIEEKQVSRIESQFQRTQTAKLLHEMPKPTIALVNGAAMGAGMSLALACDFRIITPSTVFRSAFINNALSGDYGIAYFLEKALGTPKSLEILMLSQKLDANAIQNLGLATNLVNEDQLETEGLTFAARLANGPTIAYAGIKKNLVCAAQQSLSDYLWEESTNQVACSFSEDIKEAAKAFIEKRPPQYQGR